MPLLSEKINNFFNLKKNKRYIYIIILLVVIMLVAVGGTGKQEETPAEETKRETFDFEGGLSETISKIEGVGRVKIFVSYESGTEEIVQTDISESTSDSNADREEKTVVIGSGNAQKPFVRKELYPKVRGVLIVCDGGGDTGIKNNIISAVKAVTGISAAKIGVFKMKSGGKK